jgi:hypothetical protein
MAHNKGMFNVNGNAKSEVDPRVPGAVCVTIPGLQRIISLRFMLRSAWDTPLRSEEETGAPSIDAQIALVDRCNDGAYGSSSVSQ